MFTCDWKAGKWIESWKAGKWIESWKEDWRERDKRGELYLLKFLFDFFWVDLGHPGQLIWPVTWLLDQVDYRVRFQNYDVT